MLPWKKFSEQEPPLNERLLCMEADRSFAFGQYFNQGYGSYIGNGKYSNYRKVVIDEQDEQPGLLSPTHYVLESEIPKP